MSSRVDRVHVRCRGPRSRERAALALRERLAATARTHLPAALEHRLGARGPRIFVERLAHTLDFDPEVYDDVTVATLWADAIARELAPGGGEADGVHVFADDAAYAAAAVLAVAEQGALPWWFEELPCGAGRVAVRDVLAVLGGRGEVTAALRGLADQADLAERLVRRIEPYERSLLALVLRGELPWDALGLSPTAARAAVAAAASRRAAAEQPDDGEGITAPRAAAAGRTPGAAGAGGPRPRRPTRTGLPPAPTVAELLALFLRSAGRGFAELAFDRAAAEGRARRTAEAARREGVDRRSPEAGEASGARPAGDAAEISGAPPLDEPAWWSGWGGIVFLYPWLGDLLDGAEESERLWLLGALVEPERAEPPADPLLRVLAGGDPAAEPFGTPRPAPGVRAAHASAANGTLAAFAALLPGFERSSSDFLRAHVLRREALLEPHPEGGFRLVLEPAPLDPVLVRLPYPLAAFRLPWAPLVHPERRRA